MYVHLKNNDTPENQYLTKTSIIYLGLYLIEINKINVSITKCYYVYLCVTVIATVTVTVTVTVTGCVAMCKLASGSLVGV